MIGFFDSGAGGIYVMAHCAKFFKNDYLYYADPLSAPFGNKNKKEIQKITAHAVEYLISRGAEAVVIACNTATAQAIDFVRYLFDIKIIGTEPAILPASKASEDTIAVLATPGTLESERYKKLKKLPCIIDVCCPQLASFVEDNLFLERQLKLKAFEIDRIAPKNAALVLGCTHYLAFKKYLIQAGRKVYDSNEGILNMLKHLFNEKAIVKSNITIEAGYKTDTYLMLMKKLLESTL